MSDSQSSSLSPPPFRRKKVSIEEVDRRVSLYDDLAFEFGWYKVDIHTNNALAQRQRYRRIVDSLDGDDGGINIVLDCWPTTGVIGSYLHHPRQGKTQLFRKECDDDTALKIFRNPREHTGKGYQRKIHLSSSSSSPSLTHLQHQKRRRDDGIQVGYDDSDYDGDDDAMMDRRVRKRRRLACDDGQYCRNYNCRFSHPPRCFYGVHCRFQPNCWFDHTHGLCRFGEDCFRDDCWFSHRNPAFYY
jgi:hypothetical protein